MSENTEPETLTETPTDGEDGGGGESVETTVADLEAQVAKWKALSQKTEKQAKANDQAVRQLGELRKNQLTDQERLVESAKDETRLAVRVEFAGKLVDAELKSSLAGRSLDASALLDFDKSTFITDGGDVDSDAIGAWVEAHSTNAEAPKPDLGQGARGDKSSLAQIRSREELQSMKPSEILAARNDGRLDSLMGKP